MLNLTLTHRRRTAVKCFIGTFITLSILTIQPSIAVKKSYRPTLVEIALANGSRWGNLLSATPELFANKGLFNLLPPADSCLTDTTQADFQAGTATAVDLTSSPGNVILSNAAIDQQNTTVTTNGFAMTPTSWAGQTFVPSVTSQLTCADFNLFCSGCSGATPAITVSVRATTGTPAVPTGADLATATIPGFNNGGGGYFTANFSTPATLTAGTSYALIIHPVANPSPGLYAYLGSFNNPNSNPYPSGSRVTSSNSGTS